MMGWYLYEVEHLVKRRHHDAALAQLAHAGGLTFRTRLASTLRVWADRLEPQLLVPKVLERPMVAAESKLSE